MHDPPTEMHSDIFFGIENTNFSHNPGVIANHSADKYTIRSFAEEICRYFNLLLIIQQIRSTGFKSELLLGHLKTLIPYSLNFA